MVAATLCYNPYPMAIIATVVDTCFFLTTLADYSSPNKKNQLNRFLSLYAILYKTMLIVNFTVINVKTLYEILHTNEWI